MALRIPLEWLSEHVESKLNPTDLAERLTLAGMEVESVTAIGETWGDDKVFVGKVVKVEGHPDADRLCLATVEYGQPEPLTVVTGAPNVVCYIKEPLPENGLIVPFATVGAELIDGHAGDGRKLKLKAGKIRGVKSEGMVCSEMELGLSEEHEGILVLPDDAPVGQPLVKYLGDHVLEFDIKGSFAHLQCVYGIARETAVLTDQPLRPAVIEKGDPGAAPVTATPSYINLEIEDPSLCPRYVGLLIEGITVCESPFWLKQRLIRAGQRPINAVVDVTNYVMLELGQPLHAFDYTTIRPDPGSDKPVIRVRRAKAGEKMETLDGVERAFDDQMLLITDGGGPVAVAGVMGGANSEVADTTTTILLESANFEFLNVRRTSQVLKLRTEAGDRFGKRLDPGLCLTAALRAARLIAEICGGTVREEYGDNYPAPPTKEVVELPLEFVHRLLGIEIPEAEVRRILEALEFKVEGQNPFRVTPPEHRQDIHIPADLVEEVGRIYGYDRMAPTLIEDELPPQVRNVRLDGSERVRDLLIGCGLDEIITYSIVSREEDAQLYPGAEPPPVSDYVAMRNPLAADKGHLRRRLLAEGLNTLRANLRFHNRVAVFEVGAVFHPQSGQVLPNEPHQVCALITGPRDADSWAVEGDRPKFDFFDIKGVAETLCAGLEIEGLDWTRAQHPSYHPGRSANIISNGETIGIVGELHPRAVMAFGLPAETPVCAMECDLAVLLKLWNEEKQLTSISQQPPIYEDVAFIVDEALPADQVQAMIEQTGKPLLQETKLFDVYTSAEQIGPGKKSLAFSLTFQAEDRTLTDKEVAKVRGKIVKRLAHEMQAQLRGEG